MRKPLLLLFLLLSFCTVLSGNLRAQVPVEVTTRVLGIHVGDKTGTAFTMDVDGRQYLITAKHVVEGLKADDSVEITENERWVPINVKVFRCDDPVDIAVLVPPKVLTPTLVLNPISNSVNVALRTGCVFCGVSLRSVPDVVRIWFGRNIPDSVD